MKIWQSNVKRVRGWQKRVVSAFRRWWNTTSCDICGERIPLGQEPPVCCTECFIRYAVKQMVKHEH